MTMRWNSDRSLRSPLASFHDSEVATVSVAMRPRLPLPKRELFVQSASMTEKDSTRLAFQALAIVSLVVLTAERSWRLFRELNRGDQRGR